MLCNANDNDNNIICSELLLVYSFIFDFGTSACPYIIPLFTYIHSVFLSLHCLYWSHLTETLAQYVVRC